MSTRERWIVYPLLFFILLMELKSSFQGKVFLRSANIECNSLTVRTINGKPVVASPITIAVPLPGGHAVGPTAGVVSPPPAAAPAFSPNPVPGEAATPAEEETN